MKTIPAPDWSTTMKGRKIHIPGGWLMDVAEVTPCQDSVFRYGRHYRKQSPDVDFIEAEQRVHQMVQDKFESAWTRHLREYMVAQARKYAKRWPELWKEDGTLKGFDCAELQSGFFPWHNVGRRGKSWIDSMLGQMASEAGASE